MSTVTKISPRDAARQARLMARQREREKRARELNEEAKKISKPADLGMAGHSSLLDLKAEDLISQPSLYWEAMTWQDTNTLLACAVEAGYREKAPVEFRADGVKAGHVLSHPASGETVGISLSTEGIDLCAEDPAALARFQSRVNQAFSVRKLLAEIGDDPSLKVVRRPDGEIRIHYVKAAQGAALDLAIAGDGEALVDVSGIKGRSCHDITRGIAHTLEGEVIDGENKPEYYQSETKTGGEQHVQI